MTPRERFRNAINFKKTDKVPWVEYFYDETVLRWVKEGLPVEEAIKIRMGFTYHSWPLIKGIDAYSYFDECIPLKALGFPIDLAPIPKFKWRVIREDEKSIDIRIENGMIIRRKKAEKDQYSFYTMPKYLDWQVKDRKSWEEYRKRLNPYDLRRYPKDWETSRSEYKEDFESYQDGPIVLSIPGFFGFGTQLLGMERFIKMFHKDPELIHDMADYWEIFTIEVMRDAVETLKDRIDYIKLWEDLAEGHGPMISPKAYREFFLPHYKRVTRFLKNNKIDRILMDSDGNFNPLLDLLCEAGITGLWPLEVRAGMDAISIKDEYGDKFFIGGNLDKEKMVRGGEEMKNEIDLKIPTLKERGGYLAGLDHLVPSHMPLEKFKEYADYLKKALGYL